MAFQRGDNRNKQPVPPVAVRIHSNNTNSDKNSNHSRPSRASFVTFFAVVDQWFGPRPQEAPKPNSDRLKLPHSISRTFERQGSSVPWCLSGLTLLPQGDIGDRFLPLPSEAAGGSGGPMIFFWYYIPSLASAQNSQNLSYIYNSSSFGLKLTNY